MNTEEILQPYPLRENEYIESDLSEEEREEVTLPPILYGINRRNSLQKNEINRNGFSQIDDLTNKPGSLQIESQLDPSMISTIKQEKKEKKTKKNKKNSRKNSENEYSSAHEEPHQESPKIKKKSDKKSDKKKIQQKKKINNNTGGEGEIIEGSKVDIRFMRESQIPASVLEQEKFTQQQKPASIRRSNSISKQSRELINNNQNNVRESNALSDVDSMVVDLMDERKVKKEVLDKRKTRKGNSTEKQGIPMDPQLGLPLQMIPQGPQQGAEVPLLSSLQKMESKIQTIEKRLSNPNRSFTQAVGQVEKLKSVEGLRNSKSNISQKQKSKEIQKGEENDIGSEQEALEEGEEQDDEEYNQDEEAEEEEEGRDVSDGNDSNIENQSSGTNEDAETASLDSSGSINSKSRKINSSKRNESGEDDEKRRRRRKKKEAKKKREMKEYLEKREAELEQRLKRQEEREKKELIYEMWKLDKNGFPVTKKWSMEDDIYEMRFEYHKLKSESDLKDKVNFTWNIFSSMNGMAELANEKLNPFGISMDGWTDTLDSEKATYEGLLRKIFKQMNYKFSLQPTYQFLITFSSAFFMFIMPRIFRKFSGEDSNDKDGKKKVRGKGGEEEETNHRTLFFNKQTENMESLKTQVTTLSTTLTKVVEQQQQQNQMMMTVMQQMIQYMSFSQQSQQNIDENYDGEEFDQQQQQEEEQEQQIQQEVTPLHNIPSKSKFQPIPVTSQQPPSNYITTYSSSANPPTNPTSNHTTEQNALNNVFDNIGPIMDIMHKFKNQNQKDDAPQELRTFQERPPTPDYLKAKPNVAATKNSPSKPTNDSLSTWNL